MLIKFQFHIKTDQTPLNLVVSVMFWDGPHGLPADLDIPLFDGDMHWNNDTGDNAGFQIIENPLDGDTYIETFDENIDVKGFGFQIHKGKTPCSY